MKPLVLLLAFVTALTAPFVHAATLTLQVPPQIPALPPSTRAYLTTTNSTLSAPVTRTNSFVFRDLSSTSTDPKSSASATTTTTTSYLLNIACRDFDFASYGVDIKSDGAVEVYRVGGGGWEQGGRVAVGNGPLELRVLRARDFYDKRGGCTLDQFQLSNGSGRVLINPVTYSRPAQPAQKPDDPDWDCWTSLCCWDALLIGQ